MSHRAQPDRGGPPPAALRSPEQASAVIALAARTPTAAETMVLLSDPEGLPLTCVIVEGGGGPEDLWPIAEWLVSLAATLPGLRVVVASCRPEHPYEPADLGRWHRLAAACEAAGLVLLDWFVRDSSTMVAVGPLAGAPAQRWDLR